MINLTHYMVLSAVLFGIGLGGAVLKRNTIAVLMCIELMLNGVNINLVALYKFVFPHNGAGLLLALLVIVVAAAEVAVGLALFIALYRQKKSLDLDKFNLLKG